MNSAVFVTTLFFVFVKSSPVTKNSAGCSVLINGGLAEPQPLIFWPGNGSAFALPQEVNTGGIELLTGESLRLVCLGSSNRLNIDTEETLSEAIVTCIEGTSFSFNGLGIVENFENIACLSYPTHTARRTGVPCPNGEICEIGFDLGNGDFKALMTMCHDDVNQNTILVHAKIPAVIDALQRSFPRPGFVKGDFYVGVSMANIYTRINQRITLAKLVGSEDLALSYLPTTGTYYFAKGHLAAKTDFIFGSHQRSTFYYLNTVPMWQNVNAGNWGTMEANLRNLATNRNVDLDVWTGSMGVLSLADINGELIEVYLYADDNNNRAVPVPKLLFKVVYEGKSKLGAVFITVNNPYLEKLDSEHTVCTNICESITYLTWRPDTNNRGLSYCCEVDDFRKAFPDIPDFETDGILK